MSELVNKLLRELKKVPKRKYKTVAKKLNNGPVKGEVVTKLMLDLFGSKIRIIGYLNAAYQVNSITAYEQVIEDGYAFGYREIFLSPNDHKILLDLLEQVSFKDVANNTTIYLS